MMEEEEGDGRYETTVSCSTVGIAANHDRVVLTDAGSHCFYILTTLGKVLTRVGTLGSAEGNLHTPFGVVLDQSGNIIISECGNHRISIFTPGGNFLRSFGCKGSQLGMFRSPRHLCFNQDGLLVVSDEHNQRLQIFDLSNLEL